MQDECKTIGLNSRIKQVLMQDECKTIGLNNRIKQVLMQDECNTNTCIVTVRDSTEIRKFLNFYMGGNPEYPRLDPPTF